QTSVAVRTAIEPSGPMSCGAGTELHALPFQCRMSGPPPPAELSPPTAHTSLDDEPATAASSCPGRRGGGVGATLQAAPSQCSMSGIPRSLLVFPEEPTAHMSSAEIAATD